MKRIFMLTSLLTLSFSVLSLGSSAQASGTYSAAEIMFAQQMIPHHQQAIQLSKWEVARGSNAAVRKLAARIISEQSPEIAQMKTWIPSDMMMGMEMSMPGMVKNTELAIIKKASGKNLDSLFLNAMIKHHQGAIVMATPLIKSKNSEVASLCKNIITGQTAEIKEMRLLLSR